MVGVFAAARNPIARCDARRARRGIGIARSVAAPPGVTLESDPRGIRRRNMGKSQDVKKDSKKEPAKSMKEKKAAKKQKKEEKARKQTL